MYIHLPGTHYDVNLFNPQAFVSEQSLPSLSIFRYFWAVSGRYAAAKFDFTLLFILFRVYIVYN